jgi:hypothetical protein
MLVSFLLHKASSLFNFAFDTHFALLFTSIVSGGNRGDVESFHDWCDPISLRAFKLAMSCWCAESIPSRALSIPVRTRRAGRASWSSRSNSSMSFRCPCILAKCSCIRWRCSLASGVSSMSALLIMDNQRRMALTFVATGLQKTKAPEKGL